MDVTTSATFLVLVDEALLASEQRSRVVSVRRRDGAVGHALRIFLIPAASQGRVADDAPV